MTTKTKANLLGLALPIILVLITLNTIAIFSLKIDRNLHQKKLEDLTLLKNLKKEIHSRVNELDMQARSYALIKKPIFLNDVEKLAASQTKSFKTIDSLLLVLNYQPKGLNELKKEVNAYYDLVYDMVNLAKEGKNDEVLAILNENKGLDLWLKYVDFGETFDPEVEGQIASIENRQDTLLLLNTALQSLLAILGLPILIFVIIRLKRNDRKNLALLAKLQEKNRQMIFDANIEKENDSSIDYVVQNIADNLEKSKAFISQITEGNLSVKWEGMNDENRDLNKENLSGKLIYMRDEMLKVKEEGAQREWLNLGVNQLTELLRNTQSSDEYELDEVLSFIIKRVRASVGAIYISEENGEKKELVLKAAYAYDRKKFLDSRVQIGEGLIGQTYLEKEITHLRKLPVDYLKIQSGLGESQPCDLIILPLKHNDQVIGVMELATFKEIEKYKITFLESISEILASSLFAKQNNIFNKRLLQDSQVLTEKLRTQEEELKQNLEEMQATSEESERLQRELREENQLLQDELSRLKGHMIGQD